MSNRWRAKEEREHRLRFFQQRKKLFEIQCHSSSETDGEKSIYKNGERVYGHAAKFWPESGPLFQIAFPAVCVWLCYSRLHVPHVHCAMGNRTSVTFCRGDNWYSPQSCRWSPSPSWNPVLPVRIFTITTDHPQPVVKKCYPKILQRGIGRVACHLPTGCSSSQWIVVL